MKVFKIILSSVALTLLMASCKMQVDKKDIKYMPIRFKPLTRNDFTLVGNLENTVTITGKNGVPDKALVSNERQGLLTSRDANEVMYFAPGPNEAITGSLYENVLFNNVFGPGQTYLTRNPIFGRLAGFAKKLAPKDYGMNLAYYELTKKYPDVDYFINVRFDRTMTVTGKRFSETIVVKADGIKLKTD